MTDPEKSQSEKVLTVRFDDHKLPGLYLTLHDGIRVELTRENVERITQEYWNNPDKIPAEVKKAVNFQRCPFCPLKKNDLCDALRPVLPLIDVMDDYRSHDEVSALYKGDDRELHHLSFTSMQRALRYITTLSLMRYCRVGRQYWKYYAGIIPVMGGEEIVNRIYLNMYWTFNGDKEQVNRKISALKTKISVTAMNQSERLRLFCKNDAFLNAFSLTHLATEMLYDFKDENLIEQMALFENNSHFL